MFKPAAAHIAIPGDGGLPTMQAPASVRLTIDASAEWFAGAGQNADQIAQGIVDSYSAGISHFVQAMRQQHGLGSVQLTRRHMSMPGLSIEYQNLQGHETIQLIATPGSFVPPSGQRKVDLEYDGYIAWIHPGTTDPSSTTKDVTSLIINDFTVIDTEGQKTAGQTSVWVVMFGSGALRFQSLADKLNPFKAGVSEPDHIKLVKLLNQVIPGRKKVDTHLDVPGYFVMDWNLPSNTYRFTGEVGFDGFSIPDPVINGGVQFYRVDKGGKYSPLLSLGRNVVRLLPNIDGITPASAPDNWTPGSGPLVAGAGDFLVAEFYDRKSGRTVQQSWNYPGSRGQAVLVNDKPLWWLTGDVLNTADSFEQFDGFWTTLKSMVIDLSPNQSTGVGPGKPSHPELISGSSGSYLAELIAYFAERTTLTAVYASALGAYTTARHAFDSTSILSGPGLAEYIAVLIAEGQLASAMGTLQGSETPTEFTTNYAALQTAAADFDTKAHAFTDIFTATSGGFVNPNWYDWEPLWSAVNSALFSYTDYKVNGQPAPPGVTAGNPIDGFYHRKFTASGGNFSFEGWSGPPPK